jgi:hypothetical protein
MDGKNYLGRRVSEWVTLGEESRRAEEGRRWRQETENQTPKT